MLNFVKNVSLFWVQVAYFLLSWYSYASKVIITNTFYCIGVGNSFGFAGHIRDNIGIYGPFHVHENWYQDCFMIFSWCLKCFYGQYNYLENLKCSSRATLRCLAGHMWHAGRTLPRPVITVCYNCVPCLRSWYVSVIYCKYMSVSFCEYHSYLVLTAKTAVSSNKLYQPSFKIFAGHVFTNNVKGLHYFTIIWLFVHFN